MGKQHCVLRALELPLIVEAVAETRRPASAGGGNGSISMMGGLSAPAQAAAAANWWLWSFIRLCVAVIKRHSVRTADLPRR
jgi:hypothetical protein